jgi:hypothetical protein
MLVNHSVYAYEYSCKLQHDSVVHKERPRKSARVEFGVHSDVCFLFSLLWIIYEFMWI